MNSTSKKSITHTSCILLTQQIGFLLYDIRKFPLKELMQGYHTICCHLLRHPSPISIIKPQIVKQHSHFHTTHIPKMCLGVSQLGENCFFRKMKNMYTPKKSNLVTTNSTSLFACCLFGFQLHLTHSQAFQIVGTCWILSTTTVVKTFYY